MKKSIHLSKADKEELNLLIDLLGLTNHYGAEAKAIKWSVTFTIERLQNFNKVIPMLKPSELQVWFDSIQRANKLAQAKEEVQKAKEKITEVIPSNAGKAVESDTKPIPNHRKIV